ncbi:CPBP family intramembrane glutamic endopeptidase [Syntrophomonas erecta]
MYNLAKVYRKPPWGLFDIIIVYLGIILAGIIFGMHGDGLLIWLTRFGIKDTPLMYFILGFMVQFTATILLVIIMAGIRGASLKDLGINIPGGRLFVTYGLIGGMGLLLIILILSYPVNLLQPDIQPQVFEQMLRSTISGPSFLVLFIMGAVLAPLSEELFYRGMIYPVLRYPLGPIWGALVAGLIFGAAHWDVWRAIPLAVGGVVLCYLYEKSGSIFVTALAHGIWNGIMAGAVYISMTHVV